LGLSALKIRKSTFKRVPSSSLRDDTKFVGMEGSKEIKNVSISSIISKNCLVSCRVQATRVSGGFVTYGTLIPRRLAHLLIVKSSL
jgi:hypothetical protein